MARYGMAIDTRLCVGCMDCVVACQTENDVPTGFCRDWITTEVRGTFPQLSLEIRTERCNHCDNPPCVSCCPTGASHVEDFGRTVQVTANKCIGCKACQVACSEWNELRDEVGHNHGTYDNPQDLTAETWTLMRFTEHERDDGNLEWLIRKDGCMHCADPGCLKACPSPGAIIKHANGIVDFNQDHCIGCGYCITGCPFDIPRISQKDHKAYKCTLCSDRVSVGLEPACVKTCPTGAIVFGSKDEMKVHAAERIVDLKSRGYDKAGLYDPALEWLDPRPSSMALGGELLERLLREQPGCDAVFFCNDDLAQGGLLAALRLGVAVPGQVAVAGFNDLSGSDQMLPPLTTVRTPREAIGEASARLLLALMRGETPPAHSIDLGFELMLRASS